MNDNTAKTPIEDLRNEALKHYEEASSAIHHWSSFVENAIKAYNPQPAIQSVEELALKEYLLNLRVSSASIDPKRDRERSLGFTAGFKAGYSQRVDDDYPTYEQIGSDKKWEDMTELERVNYDLMKAKKVIALQKNTIDRLKVSQPVPESGKEDEWKDKFEHWLINNLQLTSKSNVQLIIDHVERYIRPVVSTIPLGSEAVEFAEWKEKERWWADLIEGRWLWSNDSANPQYLTTEQLYQLYLKHREKFGRTV